MQAATLDDLFTMNFDVGADLRLSRISPRLQRRLTESVSGHSLFDVFSINRPTGVSDFRTLQENIGNLIMLVDHDRRLALRGQLVRLEDDASLRFVGVPWLAWMDINAPEVLFDLGDFPKLDTQMDQQFYIDTQLSMVRDLEQLNEKLSNARDAEREANRVRSDLFAVMSHEMRTPLNGVISALSLIDDPRHEAERDRLIALARNSANHLMTVINYALDYSKIDAGKMRLEESDLSVETLLTLVKDVNSGHASRKGLDLSFKVHENVPEWLCGDEEKLRQILTNLVGNAIKFTETGYVSVYVSTKAETVCFEVSDSGRGIEAEDLSKVFDPFWSKDASAAAEPGTGLGLNICSQLVALMSGSIRVESTSGEGSVFYVEVPLQKASVMADTQAVSRDSDGDTECFSGRVLLVDDNQTNLMLGEMILEDLGLEVRSVSSGEEAVVVSRDMEFDLVFMDISMPGMDGLEATRLINEDPAAPPVVALTAYVGDERVAHYLENGFRTYLQKPVDRNALIHILSELLPPGAAVVNRTKTAIPVLKSETIEKLRQQVGEENFRRVGVLFMEESDRRMNALLAAWVRRDLDTVAREAHTLASSVGAFGGEYLMARLRSIELATRENNVPVIVMHMKDIECVARQTLSTIEQLLVNQRKQNE